nr:hypothetical protein [Tanacetum cinerariifolium]
MPDSVKAEKEGSPQPPHHTMEGINITGDDRSVKIDGEVYFHGKPEELPPLWFHMFEKSTLDSAMNSDVKKCAYLATRFKGAPRDWLIQQHATNAQLFTNYETFRAAIVAKYERTEKVESQILERQMAQLHQTGRAADFIQEFNLLADKLDWPDVVRKTVIMQKFKKTLRDHYLLVDGMDDEYLDMCTNIASSDDLMTELSRGSTTKKRGKKAKKDKSPKCGNCGKGGHSADKCYSKKQVNMITLRGQVESLDTFSIKVKVEGTERSALVDSGAFVNCVRSSLVSGTIYHATAVLEGPTGETLADDGRYIVETIDGHPQRLYLVPHLKQEVLLGRPYLDNSQSHNMCAFATNGPHEVRGRMRDLTIPEQEALDAYLQLALSKDWIQKSNAPQAHNVLFVPKKNGKLRMCVDYRPLNEQTRRDGYPIPLIKSLLHQVIGSKHEQHVKAILSTLQSESIRVSQDKTQSAQREVTYLGHRVTHGVVEAIIDYKAVRDWPEPQNKTELQHYMGMANYWRDFIPGFADSAAPLYALTGNDTFRWHDEHRLAYSTLKAAICSDVEINQMDPAEPLDLFFDASGVGLGAVAFQNGRPISILSRGLSPAEKNYT